MTESVSIQKLTLNMGTLGDRIWWLNQVRWGWLAYALWSNASSASAQSVRLTNIHLTASAVASVATAIANCYPPSILEQSTPGHSTYGFIDVKEGTKLRPRVLDGRDADNNVVLSRGFRCRARYDPTEMGDQAEVIVPGYGVCDLDLGDATHRFIPSDRQGHQSHALQSLSLEFFQIEDPSLVPDLLNLIGGSLCSLRMGMFWRGRRRCIALDTVAVACPRLEELHLTDFDVVLSSHRELDNWGLRKLTIHGSDTVTGLADRLRDPACRMSYQLEVLEIAVPRSVQRRTAYADAFTSLNDDYLAAAKEWFPSRSKAAVISVVDEACDNARAVHRLNESMMGLHFRVRSNAKASSSTSDHVVSDVA
ncbi:hypothetical protein PF008_g13292 [Phytophthora fragariae]|uniref:Uncharacterized protein n=1 Tax=Phytophthora fragariae TaxID=53985 RepID=A0A6G0RKE9_9STRA|nr:hypothetical protein PF008_g13292 [Phytophthora fragariae]